MQIVNGTKAAVSEEIGLSYQATVLTTNLKPLLAEIAAISSIIKLRCSQAKLFTAYRKNRSGL